MKKLLLAAISIMALVIGSLIFSVSPTRVQAAVDMADAVASNYLVNGDTPYLSNLENGAGEGYGEVALGSSATLYARAYDGFKLVGWRIEYLERDDGGAHPIKFISAEGQTKENLPDLQEENQPYYEIRYNVTNGDKFYDGSLYISQAFENLQINPVFDFKTYYNFDITNFYNVIDELNQLDSVSINGIGKIYYTEQQGEYYLNTIINKNGKHFFVGKTKVVEDKLFCVHQTLQDTPNEQLVDVMQGGFRLGEQIDVNFKIKHVGFDSLEEQSTLNYDISAASLVYNGSNADISSYLTKSKTEQGVTTAIQLNFNLTSEQLNLQEDNNIELNLKCDRLFYIEFVPYLDGNQLDLSDNTARKLILQQIQLTNYYYKFNEQDSTPSYKYLIKQARDNFGIGAQAIYPQAVYFEDGGLRYNYYQFESASLSDLSQILNDSKIQVKYNSYNYFVHFQFVLQTSDGVSILPDMNVEQSIALNRGQSPTEDINQTELSNNLGYTFVGFTRDISGEISTSETISKQDIKIDDTRPQNIIIYMVYNYTQYTVQITGNKEYLLNNNGNEIHPFSYVTLYNSNVSERVSNPKDEITFDNKFILVDEFSINFRVNTGFELVSFAGQQLSSNTIQYKVADLIADSVGKIITLNVEFNYISYSLDYYINSNQDTALGNIFMGDISLELSQAVTGDTDATINPNSEVEPAYGRVNVEITKTDNKINIHLTGLHLYDKIKLVATPKTKQENTKYQFNRFFEDGINKLTEQKNGEDYYIDYQLLNNARVEVSFVEPTTLLEVVTNLNAINLTRIKVTHNGKSEFLKETGQIINIETGKTIVEFDAYSYNGSGMNFGYTFLTATIDGLEDVRVSTGDTIKIEFTLASNPKYTLNLQFKEIDYTIKIKQTNSTADAKEEWQNTFVKFDGQEYTTLNVSNLEFGFTMPDGYYANRIYLNSELEIKNLQTNQTIGNQFYHQFMLKELEDIVNISGDGESEIVLTIEYTIHTYNLTISFSVNSDRPEYDDLVLSSLPTIQISQAELTPKRVDHSYVYENIAYNTVLTVSVTGGIPDGLLGEGWFNKFGAPLSADSVAGDTLNVTILNNDEYQYRLTYQVYEIRLTKVKTDDVDLDIAGNPYSMVNGKISQQVRMYDTVVINAAPVRENGYTYNYIAFDMPQGNLSEFNQASLQINSFNVLNFLVKQENDIKVIEFKIAYNQLNISTITTFEVLGEDYLQEYENEYGFVDATFNYLRYSDNGFVLDNSNTPLHYRDIVQIGMNFITAVGSEHGLNLGEIHFKDGLRLQVFVGGELLNFSDSDSYDHFISFNLNSVLKYLTEDNQINIKFSYTILQKQLTYTTNISDPEFYQRDGQNYFSLNIHIDNPDTNTSLPTDGNFSTSFTFLTHARLSYSFGGGVNSEYAENLVVVAVNAYVKVATNDGFVWQPIDLNLAGASLVNDNFSAIEHYYINDVKIELVIQPKIEDSAFHSTRRYDELLYRHELDDQQGQKVHKFYGDYLFINPSQNQGKIVGYHQLGLTIGQAADNNITLSSYFAKYVQLKYYKITDGLNILEENALELNDIVDAGQYLVGLIVANASSDDQAPLWLKQMGFNSYHIILEVVPVTLTVNLASDAEIFYKDYNGPTGYIISQEDFANSILPKLDFGADKRLNIQPDGSILGRTNIVVHYLDHNFTFNNNSELKPRAEITKLNPNDTRQPYEASTQPYNIKLSNLNLVGNKNFIVNKEAILDSAAMIRYKEIRLQNLHFRDKVYDGTNVVEIDNRFVCSLNESDIKDNYNSSIKLNDLIDARFAGDNASEIGANKPIEIANLDTLLSYIFGGEIAKNYVLKLPNEQLSASIYPYKISTTVDGFGTVSVVNEVGKTNPNKVSLIPFDAQLVVETIKADTSAYNRIYRYIAGNLKNKAFVVGYRIKLVQGSTTSFVPNELMLQLPTTSGLSGVIHLNNDNIATQLNYTLDGNIQIDLSSVNQPNLFIIIKNRSLLTWWQILLIVLLVLIIIAVVVTIIVVRRVRAIKKYKQSDKI